MKIVRSNKASRGRQRDRDYLARPFVPDPTFDPVASRLAETCSWLDDDDVRLRPAGPSVCKDCDRPLRGVTQQEHACWFYKD